MKAFQLHDGEDGETTERMHAFIEDPIVKQGHDWDGGNHGVNLILIVNAGDTMLVNRDDSIRVLRKDEEVKVTADSFPVVHRALVLIEIDNGGHHANRILRSMGEDEVVNFDAFGIPYHQLDRLVATENALWELRRVSYEHFDDFINGEQGEVEAFIKITPIAGLETAHAFLNDWFNKDLDKKETEG